MPSHCNAATGSALGPAALGTARGARLLSCSTTSSPSRVSYTTTTTSLVACAHVDERAHEDGNLSVSHDQMEDESHGWEDGQKRCRAAQRHRRVDGAAALSLVPVSMSVRLNVRLSDRLPENGLTAE
jgi:hypothetical protein